MTMVNSDLKGLIKERINLNRIMYRSKGLKLLITLILDINEP